MLDRTTTRPRGRLSLLAALALCACGDATGVPSAMMGQPDPGTDAAEAKLMCDKAYLCGCLTEKGNDGKIVKEDCLTQATRGQKYIIDRSRFRACVQKMRCEDICPPGKSVYDVIDDLFLDFDKKHPILKCMEYDWDSIHCDGHAMVFPSTDVGSVKIGCQAFCGDADRLFTGECRYNNNEGYDTCFCKSPPAKKQPPPEDCELSQCTADGFSYSCATEKFSFTPKTVGGKTVSEITKYSNGREVTCHFDTTPRYCKDDRKAYCVIKGTTK